MSTTLDPILLIPGKGLNVQLPNPNTVQAVILSNKSSYDLQISGLDYSGPRWHSAGTENLYKVNGATKGVLSIQVVNTANLASPPASIALLTVYFTNDSMPTGSWPVTIPTQIVQSNIVTTIANQIVNDASAAATSIIESTASGSPASNVAMDNIGNMTIAEYIAGVRTTIFQLIAGATTVVKLAASGRLTEVLGDLLVDGTTTLTGVFVTGGFTINSNKLFGSGGVGILDWSIADLSIFAPPSHGIILQNGTTVNSSLQCNSFNVTNGIINLKGNDALDASGANLSLITQAGTNMQFQIAGSGAIATVDTNGFNLQNGRRLQWHDGSHIYELHGFSGTGNGTFSHGCSQAPTSIQLTTASGTSTQTMGYNNVTSTTVDVHTGSGLAWTGIAIVY